MRDTIYALSSGQVPAGVAVIRLSGPAVRFALETLCGAVPEPRAAVLKSIRFQNGELIDRGLVLFFPAPASFTGEDCAELQLHGGRAVVDACCQALGALPGLRQAEGGEFTRRAFDNGKMDLTAVEGLADLIQAETAAQRRMALDQAGGALAAVYAGWAQRLTHARAMIEAELDFSDEEDVPNSLSEAVLRDMRDLSEEIGLHLSGMHWGEIVREGYRVALVGRPNSGKSTLLNRLADREIAIVSDEAGTTRDIVEVRLDLGGYLVILQDTAGLRDTTSAVEKEGIRRALQAVESADLVLYLVAPGMTHEGAEVHHPNLLRVRTMSDRTDGASPAEADISVSALSGAGVDQLVTIISNNIKEIGSSASPLSANRQRHRDLLNVCREELSLAATAIGAAIELRSEHLRLAGAALGRMTGRVDVEDLLGVIFSEFCVGK
ncbi:tRNA uridine-5-carboxymethylaminomethyl(34) synthesis GTPase MnmE [Hoeflea marina]|uniref:tRNA uridine-5-carboxymethylaminomethyl(34) synthesis GTPase MnmE n=1 Tax=Hoeflea marina TaxID=274592 RepID=UPI001FE2325C|nr:tRNA uridine-5-carboxymethylaminomethyl(34) synthesis GTPase MnmE [Hoeflea marina]